VNHFGGRAMKKKALVNIRNTPIGLEKIGEND
jgi:hypothetical protein